MADAAEEPEDDIDGDEEEDGAGKKGGLKKKLLFIGLPVLLIVLLGSAAAMMFLGGDKKDAHDQVAGEQTQGDAKHGGKKAEDTAAPVYYELPPMFANIQNDDGETAVLKLVVLLEVDNEETISKIEPLLPRIVDRYQGFLRELRMEDVKGSAGYYRLKLELLRRVNQAVAPVKVNDLTIDTLLVN